MKTSKIRSCKAKNLLLAFRQKISKSINPSAKLTCKLENTGTKYQIHNGQKK
jgi:hypothetical protein